MMSRPHNLRHRRSGFTVVELLIVIVVVGILATLTIVGYGDIKQRTDNTAIIDAASKTFRMVQAYITAKDAYPIAANTDICVTTQTGCTGGSANATFEANIATIGTLPRRVPNAGATYGIALNYNSTQSLSGVSQPLRLTYYLSGTNRDCGLEGVVQFTWPNYAPSTTGYTHGNINSSGQTLCWVSVPGPRV